MAANKNADHKTAKNGSGPSQEDELDYMSDDILKLVGYVCLVVAC